MARFTYHRSPRLKSRTQVTADAENPWLDDRTTSQYPAAASAEPQVSPRTAAASSPPSAASPTVRAPRPASIEPRGDAAVERFWNKQSHTRRAQIMSRVFDPPWLRALAALVGIAMCVVFGWVLVAGPELPSFTPKTKTLVPGFETASVSAAANLDAPQPMAAVYSTRSSAVAAPAQPLAKHAAARPLGSSTNPGNNPKRARTRQSVAMPAAPAASSRPATLRINSRPWSEVFIDEKSIGPTPQLSISLERGVHDVRLHNRQRNLLKILTLHVLPGEKIDRVELLEP